MKNLITFIVFIFSVIQAFFKEEELEETATEIVSISGSQTQIAFIVLIPVSVLVHLLMHVSMLLIVPTLLIILVWIYHFFRVVYSEAKALL